MGKIQRLIAVAAALAIAGFVTTGGAPLDQLLSTIPTREIVRILKKADASYWYWLLLIVPILALILFRPPGRSRGELGEYKVNTGLSRHLDPEVYRLIENVTLPFGAGTAQIDHLIVSPYGIFVIETKHISGWIYGQPNQLEWRQVHFSFKQRFRNPLLQNDVHDEAVRHLLGLQPGQVRNVVVFVGACTFRTPMPPEVVRGVSDLVDFIRSKQVRLFTEDEIGRFIERIQTSRLKPGVETERAHLQYAQERKRAASTADPGIACPRCGGPMIEQANRRTGERFLGCRRFPRCKGVLSLS
jgi:restriction system protein